MTDKIVLLTTCESEDEARRIARALVEAQLAACVNIVPRIASFYRWKGAVEEATEYLLLVKTSLRLASEARAAIEQAHSYELPEAIALPVAAGSERYLEWLEAGLKREGGPPR